MRIIKAVFCKDRSQIIMLQTGIGNRRNKINNTTAVMLYHITG